MWLEKINEIKKKSGKTIEEISNLSNIPIGTLNKVFAGQTKDPKIGTLRAIVHCLGFTLDDLEDYSTSKANGFSAEEYSILESYTKLDLHGKKIIKSILDLELERIKGKEINELAEKIVCKNETPQQTIPIKRLIKEEPQQPKYSFTYFDNIPVCAGNGYYSMDIANATTIELTNPPPKDANYLIKISGDSMEPTIHNGDKIFIKNQKELHVGEIGIFILNNEFLIKELGENSLISHNKNYQNITINEYDNLICRGKFLEVCKEDI